MKDIKKLLREQAKDILPDERVKQNIAREMGYGESEEIVSAGGGTLAKRKKIWLPLLAAFLAIAVIIAVLLPALLSGKNGPARNPFDKFAQITDADSFYAYGALSAGTLLAARGGAETFAAAAGEGRSAVTLREAVSPAASRAGAQVTRSRGGSTDTCPSWKAC